MNTDLKVCARDLTPTNPFPYVCFGCGRPAKSRCNTCKCAVFCGEQCFAPHRHHCLRNHPIGEELFCFSDEHACLPAASQVLRLDIDPIPLAHIHATLSNTESPFTIQFRESMRQIVLKQLATFARLKTQLAMEVENFHQRFNDATGLEWKEASDVQRDRHAETHSALVAKLGAVQSVMGVLGGMEAPKEAVRTKRTQRTRTQFELAFDERRIGLMSVILDIDNLIGMQNIKNQIAAIIVQYIYDPDSVGRNHMNIALGGPPGTGKSTIAVMLMRVFYNLGVLPKPVPPDELAKKTGGDLISAFAGSTPGKTSQFMTDIIGSVGFLDEAYSLAAQPGERGSYGKEAIDAIVSALDQYEGITCLIVAGYAEDLRDSFFNANVGMPRRFPMRWETESFTADQLNCILAKMLAERNAVLAPDACASSMSLIRQAHAKDVFKFSNAGGIKSIVDFCIRLYTVMRYHGNDAGTIETIPRVITAAVFRNAIAKHIRSSTQRVPVFYETDLREAARKQQQEGSRPSVYDESAMELCNPCSTYSSTPSKRRKRV